MNNKSSTARPLLHLAAQQDSSYPSAQSSWRMEDFAADENGNNGNSQAASGACAKYPKQPLPSGVWQGSAHR